MSSDPTAQVGLAKTAVVTGGSRGIGFAIGRALVESGWRVALIARSAGELDEAVTAIASPLVRCWAADVTDATAMSRVLDDVAASLGPIELLVNNAGAVGQIGPFADVDGDDWWRVVEVNLSGAAICMRALLPRMQMRGSGRIINVVSGAGALGFTNFSAYVASKTALVRLTECVAAEAKPYGVSVFAMEPGTVATGMADSALTTAEGRRWLPWFKRLFDEGVSVPPETPARRVLELASGEVDALSGRYIPLHADLRQLVAAEEQIRVDALYMLRVRHLPSAPPKAALAAIRAQGEAGAAGVLQLRNAMPASRDEAFGLWSDSRLIARWFLPPGSGADWAQTPVLEPRAGGRLDFDVRGHDGTVFHLYGMCRRWDTPRAIELVWNWDSTSPALGAGRDTLVTVSFTTSQNGTGVMITHEGFSSVSARDAHIRGWRRCLNGMAALLALPR
jgi:NAD(P)-dependent dehydrogenase (short-subunit alcohol dehydrogenase family)/uncharacterized protein YndB with AHSA1/START domain